MSSGPSNRNGNESIWRFPSWKDLLQIVSFKTFYLILIVALLGIALILLDRVIFPPSLDPANQTSPWRGILLALGATFLTSSTVSIFFELFLRLDIVDFISSKILNSLPSTSVDTVFYQSGLSSFENSRASLSFDSLAKGASGYLKIIGFSANDIFSAHTTHIISERLKTEREFYVKVLIINPWSIMAQRRAEAIAYPAEKKFFGQVWAAFTHSRDVFAELKATGIDESHAEARLYDVIPSVSMIIDSSKALVTPLVSTKTGGSSPCFIVKRTSSDKSPYSYYEKHFDWIWNNAQKIADKNLDDLYKSTIEKELERVNNLPSTFKDWSATKLT